MFLNHGSFFFFFFQILKSDVDAALKVLNFAIYHQELTDMEDRRQHEESQKADNDGDNNNNGSVRRKRKPDATTQTG